MIPRNRSEEGDEGSRLTFIAPTNDKAAFFHLRLLFLPLPIQLLTQETMGLLTMLRDLKHGDSPLL